MAKKIESANAAKGKRHCGRYQFRMTRSRKKTPLGISGSKITELRLFCDHVLIFAYGGEYSEKNLDRCVSADYKVIGQLIKKYG